jgi:phage terminase large subunit
VVEPFDIPRAWARFRAIDYGLDMLACLWIATAPDGRAYVYRELKAPGLVVSEAARAILDRTPPGEEIAMTYAPPDLWSRQKDTGRTMAELFAINGVPVARAGNNRVQGHVQIKEALRAAPDDTPGIRFFSDCRGIIADLASIQADERNPNDCAVTPHDVTHAVDALRYYCASRPPAFSGGEDGGAAVDWGFSLF